MPAVATDADDAGATYYVNGTSGLDTADGSEKTPFKTIAKALEKDDVSKIVLKSNVTEYVTIDEGKDVELDLNGFKLTNSNDAVDNKSVILNNGKLTISDSSAKTGEINANNKKVAVSNAGILEIKGGKFTNTVKDNYVNYLLNNNGSVTINGGSFVMADPMGGTNSSIVKNGWNDPASSSVAVNDVVKWEAGKTASMTIKGGVFKGPTYVKNDSYGVMTINDGSFITTATTNGWSGNCVFNGAKLTVNGGTFDNTASTNAGAPFYVGGDVVASETVINGGTYKINEKYLDGINPAPLIRIVGGEANQDLSIEVSADVAKKLGGHHLIRTVDGTLGDVRISVGSDSVSLSSYGTNNACFGYDKALCIDELNLVGNNYFGGNVKVVRLTFGNNSTMIVEKNAEVTIAKDTKGTQKIVNLGGSITVNGKKVDATATEVTVENDVDKVNEALAAGAPVEITGELVLKDNDEIVVKSGGSVTGTVKYSTTDSISFNGVTGDFKVFKGNSIDIRGNITGGTIEVTTGAVEIISGKIVADTEIKAASGATVKFSGVTVNSGVTLTLAGSGTFTVVADEAFNLYGSIANGNSATAPATPAVIDVVVPDKATFKAYSGSQIAGTILVTGNGSIDLTQAQNPQTVGEDISYDKTYGQLENVTVVGSLTIKNNSTVTVKGGFQVNEGVTVTIEKGSKLVIDSLAASMIVDGRIVVEEGATLEVKNAKDVKVSGSIESEGTVVINSNVAVKSGGSIVINDNSTTVSGVTTYNSTFSATKDLVVEAGAELIIKSKVAEATVTNKGTVTLDGAVLGGAFNVNMAADKAVVQILKVQAESGSKDVTITDEGLVFADKKKVGGTGTEAGGVPNSVTITVNGYDMKGLTVVETISSVTKDGTTTYYNNLDLAGAVSIASVNDTAVSATRGVVSVSGDRIAITAELTLGKYVKLTVTDKKVSVSGKLVATEDESTIDNNGEITVTGLVQVIKNDAIRTINAAMYESKIGTTTVYNYTTLKAAIDSGAKDITVSGTVYVTESVTVPAGVTIKNNGEIVVGSADDTEVVLTVADTASIKYGKVTVDGTLYFENKKDNKAAEIVSDVSVIGEKDARYTNLFTALNNAKAGETVTVDKTTVDLKKSITIKEGVTLDVPNSKALKVYAGVTITVNGTLKTAEKIETATFIKTDGTEAQVTFDLAADKLNGKAAIIVNGVFMSGVEFSYNGAAPAYMIPGAYYSLTDDVGAYNYVTTLENASKTAATSVTVYGKVSAGDVVFTGTDSEPKTVTVAGNAELTVSSITLDKTTFVVAPAGKFTGDVKAGDAAVSAKYVKNMTVSVDKDGLFTVSDVEGNAATGETASFKVSAGSVYIETASMNVTVSAGATMVSADSPTVINGKLTIEGTVSVANEQTITVTGDVIVKGALSVADATDSKIAGTFNANNLYVGVAVSDVYKAPTAGDAASVSGEVSVAKAAFVKADATVSEATIESFKVDGVLKSTTYVVEGKDWMTVYDCTADNSTKVSVVNQAPVKDAKFEGKWLDTDGKSANDSKIGASKCDKVTAEITYEIYTISITPCAGIESIAIDGNLIQNMFGTYVDVDVKAGSHTITYSLANGYSGEAKLSLVKTDKTTASVSGMSFTVSGDEGDVYLQLTGIEKSGYVDPSPDMPSGDKDDGMTITDYLLIVLVVLIVIMAVIVAMRLMRS